MNETIMQRFRKFVQESIRVLKVTRKPGKDEYMTIVKMSGLGMLIIGLIGFIIQMTKTLIFQG